MSGTLPNIALVPQFDQNGVLMAGALLRLYEAGTTIAVTSYKDDALTAGQEHPFPIVADSAGRFPMFFLTDGNYRARVSNSTGGYVAFDIQSIATVGPSSGGGGGGGGGTPVSSEVLYQTGDLKQRLGSGTHAGFVRLNGRTIGSASSGASERANNDTAALYDFLHALPDSVCPVVGGRGASSSADFGANKPITLPDASGRVLVGCDDMGAGSRNRLTAATFASPSQVGAGGGAETQTLTTSQMPPHGHTVNELPHTHGLAYGTSNVSALAGVLVLNDINSSHGGSPGITNATATGISLNNTGGGSAHPNVQPSLVVTIYVKL